LGWFYPFHVPDISSESHFSFFRVTRNNVQVTPLKILPVFTDIQIMAKALISQMIKTYAEREYLEVFMKGGI
jgi:hypothetical protein